MTHISIQRLMGACALALASLLSACGGASSTVNPLSTKVNPGIANARVIAFGDALSDVGATNSGLRYTVDDGSAGGSMTVAERLAFIYGFTSMTAVTDTHVLTGGAYSYAQGEARVTATGTATPLVTQVANFLTNNTPGDNDLIIITAGTRDIIYNANQYFTNSITANDAKANVAQAAVDLANVVQSLTARGAKHVMVVAPFNVARTPWGLAKGANYPTFSADYSFLQQLSILSSGDTSCASFGCQLTIALVNRYHATSYGQPVLLVDIAQYFNLMTGTGAGASDIYGRPFPNPTGNLSTFPIATSSGAALTNPDVPVCLANISSNSHCTNLTIKNNDTMYNGGARLDYSTAVFADDVNLTPAANRMIADYIYNTPEWRAAWR
jgi:phospholipase/lecithinase/hemolysin